MFCATVCRWAARVTREQVCRLVRAKQVCSPAVADVHLIDVRSTNEVSRTGVIPSAYNIPLPILKDVLDDKGDVDAHRFEQCFGVRRPRPGVSSLIFYCAHGIRSETAAQLAEELGFQNAANYCGGWSEWAQAHEEEEEHVKDQEPELTNATTLTTPA